MIIIESREVLQLFSAPGYIELPPTIWAAAPALAKEAAPSRFPHDGVKVN